MSKRAEVDAVQCDRFGPHRQPLLTALDADLVELGFQVQ